MQTETPKSTGHHTHDVAAKTSRMRLLPLMVAALIAAVASVTSGCKEGDPVALGKDVAEGAPTMLTRNVETLISDSGVTRLRINTPVWYVYDEVDEPYWRFPEGVKVVRYDDFFRVQANITADSATYYKKKELWKLDGNVNITNVAGQKFLTNQLFWNQRQHKLYSDSFIHIERPDKVLEGYGFESDERMTRYKVHNVSGIFPAEAFRSGTATGTASSAAKDNDSLDNEPAPLVPKAVKAAPVRTPISTLSPGSASGAKRKLPMRNK